MGLMKVANDTLEIVFADSYLRIKGIETNMENDTLYIRVTSIGHIHSSEKILVPLKSNIKGVCLQNDKYWNIDSIPWSPTLNK
ncbi:hypothetical protein [Dysgonomonas sp. ZJ709]|uniref:hypothetical protein n=1 Tax=Dysgonomonas sp. ZJ709 TaxID=2709797 RepID=UPI0013E9B3D2|nr:hypothetical protein [Dysgonomonas sp. ZJ709]